MIGNLIRFSKSNLLTFSRAFFASKLYTETHEWIEIEEGSKVI